MFGNPFAFRLDSIKVTPADNNKQLVTLVIRNVGGQSFSPCALSFDVADGLSNTAGADRMNFRIPRKMQTSIDRNGVKVLWLKMNGEIPRKLFGFCLDTIPVEGTAVCEKTEIYPDPYKQNLQQKTAGNDWKVVYE
jgi:hypothetical protein